MLVSDRRAKYSENIGACVYTFVKFDHLQAFRDTVLDKWRDGLISEKLGKSMMATTADKCQMVSFFSDTT